jgi:hypothetical protein
MNEGRNITEKFVALVTTRSKRKEKMKNESYI